MHDAANQIHSPFDKHDISDILDMQVVTKAIITLLVAFSCWSSVSAGNLADTVKSCGDGIQLPFEIFVDGCDQNPCTVRNGTLVHFEMSFVAGKPIILYILQDYY